MNVIRKDATISNVDEDFPGAFEVVLSTATKDRDGDELAAEDWKQPLPDRITFDVDHGMSVEKTVGSGVPSIEDGRLVVRGTYSSLPRAQEVRTLVREGHISTTSVAFASEKVTKDGKSRTVRELLNGAFVAIPANPEAVVLSAKAGARNSVTDQKNLQVAHDAIVAAGAECGPMDDSGAAEGATGGKSAAEVVVKGRYDAATLRTMLAKGEAMKDDHGNPSYPIGDKDDLQSAIQAVGRGSADHDKIRAYIIGRAKALNAADMIPDSWNADGSLKSFIDASTKAMGDPDDDPGALAQAVDAALDEAQKLISTVDASTLPEPIQQALGLITAAENSIDDLLDMLGVADPDDLDEETTPNPEKSADADALSLQMVALQVITSAYIGD